MKLLDNDPFLSAKKKDGLEKSTIDRYQGRDKDVIILSFVRSNILGRTGRLLNDYRRLNVALSRAKKKLIMIGSFQTLSKGSEVLAPILKEIKHKRWVENLQNNALDVYREPIANYS